MATQSETERKYALNGTSTLPALDTVEGVTSTSPAEPEQLDAVYFDTQDLRLARWGLTLRRRRGGHDTGWHLKVPAGKNTRHEIHRPLGTARPPEDLVQLLAGVVRGARLVPVARIVTDRHRRLLLDSNGKVLAEVTDDRVVAGRSPRGSAASDRWRELEVELAGGDPGLLDKIEASLRDSGLRRSSDESKLSRVLEVRHLASTPGKKSDAGQAVLGYLTKQVAALLRNDVLAREGADDAVHQLRVAARRIRSVLRVFGKVVDRDRTRELDGELRWLTRRLSSARDLEVLEQRLRERIAAQPDTLVIGPVMTRLTRYFAPTRQEAERTVRRTIGGRRYGKILDALEQLLDHPPLTARAAKRARKELPRHVRKAYRKVAARRREVERRPSGKAHEIAMHRTRKAAKRLRYATEAAQPVIGSRAKRTRTRAKTLTKVLGRFQDSVVARPVLRQLGATTHVAGENGFTFGLLYGYELIEAEHAGNEWGRAYNRLSKKTSWFA